ncbi:hypothetical protein DFAR_3880001 [Desulfarculales bacterium]
MPPAGANPTPTPTRRPDRPASQEALAVEDTPTGAASALATGIATYIISPQEQRPQVPGVAGYIRRLDELIPLLPGAPGSMPSAGH